MSLLKSLGKVGACTSIMSSPERTNHSMSGPWLLAGTSSPFAFFGVAVTYPRQPRGSSLSPFRGTGFPFPQLMPKNPTRMLSMMLAGRPPPPAGGVGDGFGVGVGVGAGVAGVAGEGG